MGRLHLLLGDPDSAERDSSRARWSSPARSGLSRGITLNLIALGDLQFRREELAAAAASYEQARSRSAESEEQQLLAESLLRLALVHREQEQLPGGRRESQSGARDRARDRGASGRGRGAVRPGGTAASPRADGRRTRGFRRGGGSPGRRSATRICSGRSTSAGRWRRRREATRPLPSHRWSRRSD